jgi:uncharacterized membrane protein YdjX (TVP38/TMEM64 family)
MPAAPPLEEPPPPLDPQAVSVTTATVAHHVLQEKLMPSVRSAEPSSPLRGLLPGTTVPASDTPRSLRNVRIAAVLVVVAMLVGAHQAGILHELSDPASVKRALVDLGPWGYLAFVAAYAIFQPFGVPGTVFIVAAPLIWPWSVAFVLSMIGTMLASIIGFSFARFVARDWVSRFIPERFEKYDEALERRGFATVFLLRLIFWMPPLLHAFFGVSKVRFWTHFWGSLLGYVLPLLLTSYFGAQMFSWMRQASIEVWAATAAGIAMIWIAVWIIRRRAARTEAE